MLLLMTAENLSRWVGEALGRQLKDAKKPKKVRTYSVDATEK